MKKFIIPLASFLMLAACGGNSGTSSGSDTTAASTSGSSTEDVSNNPDYKKGLALVASSDCLACHKVNEKLTGPAYQDVANKYAGMDTAVTYLAHRIINGVGANDKHDWGTETNNAIMTPHPQVSQADAEQMVKYILLLKTK